jgi:hypothetical protein
MKSEYKSPKSVAKNQAVYIRVDDPRVGPDQIDNTRKRIGADLVIVGLDGKPLSIGGRNLTTGAGGKGVDRNKTAADVVVPPINNQPPKVYPGGSGPTIIVPTDPTNVSAVWSGDNLVISFDWDYINELNSTISQFIVELTAGGVTRRTPSNTFIPNKTQTAQTVTVNKSMITSMFNVFRTSFSSICVLTGDPLNNISNSICAATIPTYVLDLPTPVINVASITSGYSVSYTTPTQDVFDGIEIVEYESTASTEPTEVTYKRTFFNTLNPAVVLTPNFNKRWVKARFSSDGGVYTAFSAAQAVTPTVTGSLDLVPPNEVVSASAAWSGDNIVVSYELPSSDPGIRVEIVLTSSNSLVGYFYRFPAGSGTSQTATITKRDILEQFGQHYSSFTGVLKSIDSNDNRTDGVSFNVIQRANPLTGIVPTFSLAPLTNGYSVFATNYESSVGVNYMEVYAKHTPWITDPSNDDDVVYRGPNPAVVIDTDYTEVYIKVRYYDDFDNSSSYSNQTNNSTTPLDAGIVTSFENPITFGVNGVIYAGANYDSGNRTLFKTGGIFAYDADGVQTTQILSDADAGTPTFITQRAQIADWNITDTKIENDLSGTPTSYTGLSATGTYSFWAGSTVSGGNETSKFTVKPTGEVTAREITILGNGGTGPLISAGGLFTVNNDGSFTATSADIQGVIKANSGEFLGNVLIKSNGSLYSPKTTGTVPSPGVAGVIFDNDAISAFGNNSSSYTQMYSTPLADGSTFKTTAADIGGWKVSESSISRTGATNISLNATSGNISVSAQNVSSYTSGINGPIVSTGSTPVDNINGTPVGAENVFWAGTGGATGTANAFRVTLAGNLYASNAKISGTLSSVGALGTMTMDGAYGYMSLKPSGTLSGTSYIVPRNDNIYITAPTSGNIWADEQTKTISENGPANASYFSAGKEFKDPWGNDASGIGLFSGGWDYFSNGTSDPFITITKGLNNTTQTGMVQISASPDVGIIVEKGGAVGDAFTQPTILMYTANNTLDSTPSYSPSTTYGAWATFQPDTIKLSASSSTFININGAVGNKKITIQGSTNVAIGSGVGVGGSVPTDEEAGAYSGASKIIMDPTYGVVLSGVQVQRGADMTFWDFGTLITPAVGVKYKSFNGSQILVGDGVTTVTSNGSYRNTEPLGYTPRQRMMVADPVSGEMMLGMAVYYRTGTATSAPSSSTGYAGDLLVQY